MRLQMSEPEFRIAKEFHSKVTVLITEEYCEDRQIDFISEILQMWRLSCRGEHARRKTRASVHHLTGNCFLPFGNFTSHTFFNFFINLFICWIYTLISALLLPVPPHTVPFPCSSLSSLRTGRLPLPHISCPRHFESLRTRFILWNWDQTKQFS